jgi:hypothetical protein
LSFFSHTLAEGDVHNSWRLRQVRPLSTIRFSQEGMQDKIVAGFADLGVVADVDVRTDTSAAVLKFSS